MAHCCNNSATKPDERSSGANDYILEKLILFHSCILTSRAVFQPVGEGGKGVLLAGVGELELYQQ